MNNLKKSIMSVAMAAITAASPILSSYAAYASDDTAATNITVNDDGTITQMSTSIGDGADKTDETKFLFINLKMSGEKFGGRIIIDEGETQEESIYLDKKSDGDEYIDVYDKTGTLVSSESTRNAGYTYVYEAKTDSAVTVKAKADNGYIVKLYKVTDDSSGTEIAEDVGFDAGNKVDFFKYPVFMENNKSVMIGFEKDESAADNAGDLRIGEDAENAAESEEAAEKTANSEDLTLGKNNNNEDLTVDDTDIVENQVNDDENSDTSAVEAKENIVDETETDIDVKAKNNKEANNAENGNMEEETVVNSVIEKSNKDEEMSESNDLSGQQEHFTELDPEISTLDSSVFKTARLVVVSDDNDNIIDNEHLIASYNGVYLLQYASVEQAMTAYLYYNTIGVAVEPDTVMETAEESNTVPSEDSNITVTESVNPISALSDEAASTSPVTDMSKVIALIDTGVTETKNVLNRVSLIDNSLEGNGHGNDMLNAIISQNENANVLSVRVMGNDGRGTVSSIIAGMEYAIEQKVGIINLSLSSKKNLANSVLEAEINKAVENGISVVAAAGNDGQDVKDYMPGSVESAFVIGAADENGERLIGSNYGSTVDYNVVANTTSEAAAKFSGFLTTGKDLSECVNTNGLIYQTSYIKTDNANDAEETWPSATPSPDGSDEDYDPGDDPIIDDTDEDIDSWIIDGYPEAGITNSDEQYVWVKDKTFDFEHYNPYGEGVTVECTTKDENVDFTEGSTAEFEYTYTLNDHPDYKWNLYCIFNMTSRRDMATVRSDIFDKIFPDFICQDRNEGYDGKVPSQVGEIVEGKTFNILAGTEGFDINGLLLPYNPETFKVNSVDSEGFDINTPGTYKVTFEMSYFMYREYSWYVENTVNVISKDSLESGMYLTTTEPTLSFTDNNQKTYGYGEFCKLTSHESYAVKAMVDADDGFELEVFGNDDYQISDVDKQNKTLAFGNIESDKVHFVTISRKGYEAGKLFNGGGWKEPSISESNIDASDDFEAIEKESLNKTDAESTEYMSVAEDWTTIATQQIQCPAQNGNMTGHNYGNSDVYEETNWSGIYLSQKSSEVKAFCKKNGYMLSESVRDFQINCYTHSLWGYRPWQMWTATVTMKIQKNGKNLRLFVEAYKWGGGTYQNFYGNDDYSPSTSKAYLEVYKRMKDPELSEFTERIGTLETTFGVYKDSACKKIAATIRMKDPQRDDKGNIYLKGGTYVDPGKYWVREDYRIRGTAYNTEIYGSISLKAGEKKNVGVEFIGDSRYDTVGKTGWIYNKPYYFKGDLISKIGEDKAKLKDAIFRIQYSVKGGADFNSKRTWYFKTDANGVLAIDEAHFVSSWKDDKGKTHKSGALLHQGNGQAAIPVGVIQVKEVKAPKGYELNSKVIEINFQNKTVEMPRLYQKEVKGETYTGSGYSKKLVIVDPFTEDRWKVQVNLKKVDQNGKRLEGAVFGVWDNEKCEGERKARLVSGKDGLSETKMVDGLLWENKKYILYCKEIQAPDGYALPENQKPYELTFERSKFEELKKADPQTKGELKTFGPETGIPNDEGWKVRVKAKKVDANGTGLAEAILKVYTDEACTKQIGEDLVSTDNGETNEITIGVSNDKDSITLYCKEYSAPSGYLLNTTDVKKLTFNKADATKEGELKIFDEIVNTEGNPPTPVITQEPTPEPPTGTGLHVRKVSKAPKDVMDLDSYTLKGAVFQVTSSRDGDMGTLTTDESGYTGTLTLPDNSTKTWVDPATDKEGNVIRPGYWQINEVTTTYYISEITPPNYHENNYQRQSITVTMPRDAKTTFEVTFEDVPKFNKGSSFDIEKLGVKGEPIEGVVFKVEYFDGDDDSDNPVRTWHLKTKKDGHARLEDSYLDPNQSSDQFYIYDGNIVIPIGGYLKITEEAAPAEYVLDDTPIGVQTVEGADFNFTYANNKAWYNELQRCRVDLQKFQADGTTPIAGVEFEIKFLEAAIQPTSKKHPNFKRLLDVGETTVRHTDSEGKAFFDNLDQGTYQITEIKTEPGNALLKEPIIFTLPFTMTMEEAAQYQNVDFDSAKEDVGYTNKWYFYNCKYDITNNAVFKMPMTGDDGKWKYGFIGFGMVAALGCGYVVLNTKNHKKRNYRKMKKQK